MKKLFIFASIALLMLSCDKNTPGGDQPVDPSDPKSVNVYSKVTYSQTEFCNMVGESFDDYLSLLGMEKNDNVKQMVAGIFDYNALAVNTVVAKECNCLILSARNKWSVRVYNFTYSTTSYTGQPITLSAVLCAPVLNDEEKQHTLDAMTLGLPHMPVDKEFCPTMNGNILMARVAFNHAVVVPDYQGRGITSSTSYSSLHTNAHAVQAIDAALAARTILDNEGFGLANDFSLYNIGVSEGGETAYETQKMIENDISVSAREKLNLKLSFCANGIAKHAQYIDSRLKSYTYDETFHAGEMGFYADAFDCLSEEEKQGHKAEEFFSLDLLKGDKVDTSAPVVTILEDAVVKNDITENWNPQHSITLAASRDDDDVLFAEHTQYMYDLLKETPSGNPNRNVKLLPFNTPVSAFISGIIGPDYMLSHIAADVCCFVHAIRFKDPGSEAVQIGFPDEWYDSLKELK